MPDVGEEGIGRAKMQASSINKTAFVDVVAYDSEDLSRIGVFTESFAFTKNEVDYYPAITKQIFSATGLSASTYYVQRNFTLTKSGYTPIAFNPYTNHATEAACMVNYNANAGDATVTVMSRNSTISGLNLYLDVTYARNELL